MDTPIDTEPIRNLTRTTTCSRLGFISKFCQCIRYVTFDTYKIIGYMEDSFPNTRSHENFSVVNVWVFLFKLSVGNKFTFPIDQGILLCKLLTLSLQSQSLFEQICSKQTHQVLQYQHDLCTTVSISISLV